jgi:hypothetical protein
MTPAPASLGAFSAVWFCYFGAIGLYNPYAPLWFKELGSRHRRHRVGAELDARHRTLWLGLAG